MFLPRTRTPSAVQTADYKTSESRCSLLLLPHLIRNLVIRDVVANRGKERGRKEAVIDLARISQQDFYFSTWFYSVQQNVVR